jgi:hypothetical protein
MFTGAIDQVTRMFLGNVAGIFSGQRVVVGCSGNFTLEAVITQYAADPEIHSNDVSFYSCMLGKWLTGCPLGFQVVDHDFDWLMDYAGNQDTALASVMILLDALEFEKRNNPHRVRMWNNYMREFGWLVKGTVEKLKSSNAKIKSFYEGDVLDHFMRFADDPGAIFCCYAPTYRGGYERLYKRLDSIVTWDAPTYTLLDDRRRDEILDWMSGKQYLWYDDRILPGRQPVMTHEAGKKRMVYLYSNAVGRTATFRDYKPGPLPKIALADRSLEISRDSSIELARIKTNDLGKLKDAYLAKGIDHVAGMWGFAVLIDGVAVGFLEFGLNRKGERRPDWTYLMSDFAVSGTRYRRLSKLVLMLSVCGQTRKLLERLSENRETGVLTTAFTDKPVSMKYRGVYELDKRGETKNGHKFLNYSSRFNDDTWQEVLEKWLTSYA